MSQTLALTRKRRWGILVGAVLLAALLRGWAVLRLPIDYDEPTYLQAGYDYARALRAGDWNAVIDYAENREHPALVKLLYGLLILALGENPDLLVAGLVSRALSALFGTLAVLLLALADPVAGGLLAVHTLAVKYTSQVYLEALPHFASVAAVLALRRARSARDLWFWLSALALGVTAAGKFTYLPIVFVLLYLAIWEKHIRWHYLLLYAGLSLAVFWLLNPTLWHQPFTRLADLLFFHVSYSQGSRVELASLPWYQPLYWISRSAASAWHPDVFFYPGLDGVIFLLALAGVYWEWRERRWVVVWIATSLLCLLLWPTKWPQYTLVLTPALCLAASSTLSHFYRWFKEQETYWLWIQQLLPSPPLSFWILSALVLIAVAVGYTALTLQVTLGRIGWSHFTTQSTLLPSNIVYGIVPGSAEQMVLGTEQGAAIWAPPTVTDLPDEWVVFNTENSDLPHNRVLAVARDSRDGLWFGTEAGLACYADSAWQVYRASNLGLEGDMVYALAVDSQGQVWVGTGSGAAVFDGQEWTPFTRANSGLADNWILSIETEPAPLGEGGDRIWFGTRSGVSRLDTASGKWTDFSHDFDPAWGGVRDLLLDSSGRLWAGTVGGGLGLWDGLRWQFYQTGNSDIPFNTVNVIAEVEPGVLWLGIAPPAQVGGVLAEFDGTQWKTYTPQDSGYSGSEGLAITQDAQGRRWIGTRTAGVDIFQPRQ